LGTHAKTRRTSYLALAFFEDRVTAMNQTLGLALSASLASARRRCTGAFCMPYHFGGKNNLTLS